MTDASPVLTNFCVALFVATVVVSSVSASVLFDLKLNDNSIAKSTGTISIRKGETDVVNFFISI